MDVDTSGLWRLIAADLHTLGALDETRRRVERDLQAKRDALLEAGVNPDTGRQVVTDHGTVTLAPGPVTRRRGVSHSDSGISMIAPNNTYGGYNSTVGSPPVVNLGHTNSSNQTFEFVLESTNIYWASQNSASSILCLGWIDNI
jgi:hypothetical protein